MIFLAEIELVLLTYAEYPAPIGADAYQRNQPTTNRSLRAFAQRHDLPLADAAARIHNLLSDGAAPSRYFHNDRSHPNARGYEQIAPLVADIFEVRSIDQR